MTINSSACARQACRARRAVHRHPGFRIVNVFFKSQSFAAKHRHGQSKVVFFHLLVRKTLKTTQNKALKPRPSGAENTPWAYTDSSEFRRFRIAQTDTPRVAKLNVLKNPKQAKTTTRKDAAKPSSAATRPCAQGVYVRMHPLFWEVSEMSYRVPPLRRVTRNFAKFVRRGDGGGREPKRKKVLNKKAWKAKTLKLRPDASFKLRIFFWSPASYKCLLTYSYETSPPNNFLRE